MADKVKEPIAIPKIAGRYMLFDIDVVTYLRRNHHIIGVLTGNIPMAPQQNIFSGLPLELMPEEARVLVMKGVAYIVDDVQYHEQKFSSFEGEDRKTYLQYLKSESRKAQVALKARSDASTARFLAKQASLRAAQQSSSIPSPVKSRSAVDSNEDTTDQDSLFDGGRPASPATSHTSLASHTAPAITPTTTYPPLPVPLSFVDSSLPEVPSSFPLFAHLHERGYYMSPGLRFGCHYSVYPGDPLRFHAHFLGVGYDWDQEIPLMDIVGGGRLAGGVKKGLVIGAQDSSKEEEDCRTFSIEWGGM